MKFKIISILLTCGILAGCVAHTEKLYSFETAKALTAEDMQKMDKWISVVNKSKGFSYQLSKTSNIELLKLVNIEVNKVKYISDQKLYHKNDYWATPLEFFKNGGDCEDYAIAKYMILKSYGINKSKMKIAVGYDKKQKDLHSVLIVDMGNNSVYILDNNTDKLINVKDNVTFKPIYTINETGFWKH